jgi:MFS superfamily sulfate permease-like transporter
VEGDNYWQLKPAQEGSTTQPGLAIYRFGAPLFYANADRFAEEIRAVVGPASSRVQWLVVDAEAMTNVDYTAARVVRELYLQLLHQGVKLAFARVSPYLKADLDRHHITAAIGSEMIFPNLHDALNAYAKVNQSASAGALAKAFRPGQLPH